MPSGWRGRTRRYSQAMPNRWLGCVEIFCFLWGLGCVLAMVCIWAILGFFCGEIKSGFLEFWFG